MVEVKGRGGISAKIVADSVSPAGKRITTYELEYPRFIHAEFMTHRLFSRNAASSRAIPVPKMIEHIENNTAMPVHWGLNERGMQASKEVPEELKKALKETWETSAGIALGCAQVMHEDFNAHKQIINRILEPYQFIKVVCTATEYDNFFWLRNHKDAQPEIKELAECMWKARNKSVPTELKTGEWHLPYVGTANLKNGIAYYIDKEGDEPVWVSLEEAQKISASCCAQVSYRLTDNSVDKALKIYDMLVNSKPVHASPFEHQACPMDENTELDSKGVTGYNKRLGYYSGNFFGWVQYRQLIDDNTCWDYEPE